MKNFFRLLMGVVIMGQMAQAASISTQNKFGWSLYQKLDSKENVFISPTSIYVALAFTFEGSQGETKEKARAFLGLQTPAAGPLNPPVVETLNKLQQSKNIEFQSANALWTNKGNKEIQPPSADFQKLAEKQYQAQIESVDFNPLSKLSDRINSWANEKTRKMIPQVVTPDMLSGTDLILANAVYFKGKWEKVFDPKLSKQRDFFGVPQKSQKTFMSQTLSVKTYQSDDKKFQLLELPYHGNEVSMVFLLPAPKTKLADLEKNLKAEDLHQALENLSQAPKAKVNVIIPKFEMTWGTENIYQPLAALGLPAQGDFKPLGSSKFEISKVLHKAKIKVDEEGTVAAAVTTVNMRLTSMPMKPQEFIADRPFLYMIRDQATGEWIFLGRLTN